MVIEVEDGTGVFQVSYIEVQMHPWMLVETTLVTEFEYYFAYTRKDVHLCFIMSPGKMIFAVLELRMSPLH